MTDHQIKQLIRIRDPSDPLQYAHNLVRDLAYVRLCEALRSCNDCDISCGVRTLPSGRTNAPVMVISEAACLNQKDFITTPARAANKEFSLFNAFLERYGINPDNIFYINAVNCFPFRENEAGDIVARVPMTKEVKNCRVFTDYAIKTVQPKLIILLGAVALNLFIKSSISAERGKLLEINGIPAVATYHPDYFEKIADKKDPDLIDELKIDFEHDLLEGFKTFEKMYPNHKITNL